MPQSFDRCCPSRRLSSRTKLKSVGLAFALGVVSCAPREGGDAVDDGGTSIQDVESRDAPIVDGSQYAPQVALATVPIPANDDRLNAQLIVSGGGERQTIGTTLNATHDGPRVPCRCTSGPNVWYKFVLTEREIVYFDTSQSTLDTSLFLTDSNGTALAGQEASPSLGLCNDDVPCGHGGDAGAVTAGDAGVVPNGWQDSGGYSSRTAGILDAGTYYVAVGGCASGSFVLSYQHYALSRARRFLEPPLPASSSSGTLSISGTLPFGSARTSEICGGDSSGEEAHWYIACGDAPTTPFFSLCNGDGARFTIQNGTTLYDPVLSLSSGRSGGEQRCNGDGPLSVQCEGDTLPPGTPRNTAGWGSRLSGVVNSRGINVLVVDSRDSTGGMDYTLRYSLPVP